MEKLEHMGGWGVAGDVHLDVEAIQLMDDVREGRMANSGRSGGSRPCAAK